MLPDQFIYASAYPLGPIKESAGLALKFPLSADVMEKYMYGNAARLLEVHGASGVANGVRQAILPATGARRSQ
jgi:hypothetical protein